MTRDQLAEASAATWPANAAWRRGRSDNYSHGAALFLARLPGPLGEALQEMSAGRVLEVIGELVRWGGPSARSLSVPLRSRCAFLHVTGRIPGCWPERRRRSRGGGSPPFTPG